MEVPQKTKKRTTILPRNSIPETVSEENENTNSKRHLYPNVHSSMIYNFQDMQAT